MDPDQTASKGSRLIWVHVVCNIYFSTKTYVVGVQKNHLNEMVLLSNEMVLLSKETNVKTDAGLSLPLANVTILLQEKM